MSVGEALDNRFHPGEHVIAGNGIGDWIVRFYRHESDSSNESDTSAE